MNRNTNIRNRRIAIRKVRVVRTERLPNLKEPWRIRNQPMPYFEMPQEFQVKLHGDSTIQYEGEAKLMLVSRQQFLGYQGNIKLSVAQMEIQDYTSTKMVNKYIKNINKANLWLYKGKRITTWHYDGYDNFLYQFQGKKVVYLLPPQTVKPRNVFSLYSNHIADKQQVHKFIGKMRKTVLHPNECLYIPKGWWHYIVSKGDPSIALNFWGNSYADIPRTQHENILRHLIYQISQERCKRRNETWNQIDEDIKQQYRLTEFRLFMNERML